MLKTQYIIAAGLFAAIIACGPAHAQSSAQLLGGEKEAVVSAIQGVLAEGADWELVWAGYETADGMSGMPDGSLLFTQEQNDSVGRLDADNQASVYVGDTHAAGAVSLDAQGRLFAVQRSCTDWARFDTKNCAEPTKVGILSPQRKTLADSFDDGTSLGRVNDLIADGKGGAYFTSGGLYYARPQGGVTIIENDNLHSNGVMLSPDGSVLYVTNNTSILAFDVQADGSAINRRDFATLKGDDGGDGLAIDAEGRLYVTANTGIHVLSDKGDYVGLIPVRRRAITLAFAGPDKQTLYVGAMGVVGIDGKAFATPEGVRNTSMTIYKIRTVTPGFKARPK